MLFTAYSVVRNQNPTSPVIIGSEDTDVYVQAAFVSINIQGALYIKKKSSLVNCSTMLPEIVAESIIAAHFITGSDHTSGFYGHGKRSALKKLLTDPEACDLLRNVGNSLCMTEKVENDMRSFVLNKIYSADVNSTCGQARAAKWRKQKRKSTVSLPQTKTLFTIISSEQIS